MGVSRRAILAASLAGIGLPKAAAQAAYPTRPVTIVVGFAPASATDVATRILGERLGEILGQRMVIENRPGAASRIAADAVARAPKDGYTLFVGTVANVINESLNPGSRAFSQDLAPVALFGSVPNILVVPSASEVTTVEALLKLARTAADPLTYGSPGIGTAPHLSGELLAQLAGVRLTHVPYTGSAQAVTDLLAGRLALMFAPASSALPHVQSGALRALATTAKQRTPIAPDLPTVAEAGLAGFDTGIWFGLMVPTGTPAEIVERLSAATGEALRADSVRSLLLKQGIDPVFGGPEPFREHIAAETRRWDGVIERAGLAKR